MGHPIWGVEPSKDPTTGVWTREYSAALALVNPTASPQTVTLPGRYQWSTLYGEKVSGGGGVRLQPASGLVLLKSAAAAAAK